MGLTIILQDEFGKRDGEAVVDRFGLLAKLLPASEDSSFRYLPHIDRYGSTIFNTLQMQPFLEEWRRLRTTVVDEDANALMSSVERLAITCQETDHIYLRFMGD